jgi:hypothetical protein
VRFALTAGQKGDSPQAGALIEELPAEVVMADIAYDADHLRQVIAAKGALAVIPTIRHVRSNIRWTSISMRIGAAHPIHDPRLLSLVLHVLSDPVNRASWEACSYHP